MWRLLPGDTSALIIVFQYVKLILKEISPAEHEYISIHTLLAPPPPTPKPPN